MKHLRLFLLAFIVLISAGACDIIEAPYLDQTSSASLDEQCLLDAQQTEPFGSATPIKKKVLLEEMTGHKCGNCPKASKVAHDLIDDKYNGDVILVTIHSGSLAAFTPGADKYNTNFTTESGDELYSSLNTTSAVPYGMVNRIGMNNNSSSWEGFIQTELEKAPEAGIRIYNCFDPDSQTVTSVIDVKYLADAGADEYISVILVEDNIVDWQKDYFTSGSSPDLSEYVHRDIYRGALNGTWGQPLNADGIVKDEIMTVSYSYQLQESFKPENCKIVAFVHNNTTKEIRQVEVAPLVQ